MDLERQADDVAHALNRPADAQESHRIDVHDGDVPAALRRPVEDWSGVDLSHLRVRRDPLPADAPGAAVAATDGDVVLVRSDLGQVPSGLAQAALTHELAAAERDTGRLDG